MMDLILPSFKLNLWYSQKLVADVAEDQMCAQPVAGRVMNHPAFLLGHLALVAGNFGTSLVGAAPVCPESWKELFNQGAKPLADRSRYPSKAALLQALEDAHTRLADGAAKAAPEMLAQPAPEKNPRALRHDRRPAGRPDDFARGEPQRPAVSVAAGDGAAAGVLSSRDRCFPKLCAIFLCRKMVYNRKVTDETSS